MKPVQQTITKSALRVKGKAPERFVGGPELRWGLSLYYEAFFDLDTERNNGFGISRIPWHCVVEYAVFHRFDEEQTNDLLTHIRAMDSAYIANVNEKNEAKRG